MSRLVLHWHLINGSHIQGKGLLKKQLFEVAYEVRGESISDSVFLAVLIDRWYHLSEYELEELTNLTS